MAGKDPDGRRARSVRSCRGASWPAPFFISSFPSISSRRLVDWLLRAEAGGTFLRHLLAFSGWFLVLYAAAALVCSLGAAGLDGCCAGAAPCARRPIPRPRRGGPRRRVAAAVRLGQGRFGAEGDAALDACCAGTGSTPIPAFRRSPPTWKRSSSARSTALDHATDDGRAAIVEMACAAIDHVGQGLDALEAGERERAESEARTVARYVEMRYGDSDFAGDED